MHCDEGSDPRERKGGKEDSGAPDHPTTGKDREDRARSEGGLHGLYSPRELLGVFKCGWIQAPGPQVVEDRVVAQVRTQVVTMYI